MSWSGLLLAAALTVASPEKEAVGVVSPVPPVPVASTATVDSRKGDNPAVASQAREYDNSYESSMDSTVSFAGSVNLVQGNIQSPGALQVSHQVEPTATRDVIFYNRGAGVSGADLFDFRARIVVGPRIELPIEQHERERLPGLAGSMDTLGSPRMALGVVSVFPGERNGFQNLESAKQRVVIKSVEKPQSEFERRSLPGLYKEHRLTVRTGMVNKKRQIETAAAGKGETVKSSDHVGVAGILDSAPSRQGSPVVIPAFARPGRRAWLQGLRLLRSASGILWNLPEQQPCLKGIQV